MTVEWDINSINSFIRLFRTTNQQENLYYLAHRENTTQRLGLGLQTSKWSDVIRLFCLCVIFLSSGGNSWSVVSSSDLQSTRETWTCWTRSSEEQRRWLRDWSFTLLRTGWVYSVLRSEEQVGISFLNSKILSWNAKSNRV